MYININGTNNNTQQNKSLQNMYTKLLITLQYNNRKH